MRIYYLQAASFQVNNAGGRSPRDGPETPIEAFDFVMNINVRSVIQLTQACMPDLITTQGAIVMNSSILSSISVRQFDLYCSMINPNFGPCRFPGGDQNRLFDSKVG